MTNRQPFSTIGNHPALDFVNTRPAHGDALVERLSSFDDLLRWALQFGAVTAADGARLAHATRQARANALAAAIRLREALRTVFESRWSARTVAVAKARISAALAHWTGHLEFAGRGHGSRLEFSATIDEPGDVVAALARHAADLLALPQRERIKRCEAADCVLWFFDASKNGSRHWCRMDRCGARAKAAAYYRRRRKSSQR